MRTFAAINKIALPTLLFRVSNMFNTFIGMYMIAQLGRIQLAAGALIMSFTMMMLIAFGPLYALGAMLSRLHGEEDYDQISIFMTQAIYFALILACGVGLLFLLSPFILMFFHQNPAIISVVREYMYTLILNLLPTFIIILLVQFSSAVSTPKQMSLLGMAFVPVTAFLGYGFVFGHFGLPTLGVPGFALALSISNWLMMCASIVYFKNSTAFEYIKLFKGSVKPNFPLLVQMFKRGAPVSLQFGGELSASAVSNFFMGWFGVVALAAQQIVMQIFMLVNMLPFCVAQATSMIIGRNLGSKNHQEAQAAFKVGLIYIIALCGVVTVIFIWGAPWFVQAYLPKNVHDYFHIEHVAKALFLVSALLFTMMALSFYFAAVLRVFHDFAVPMKVSVLSYWVLGVPFAYFLAFTCHFGPVGIRLAFSISVGVSAVILGHRLFRKIFDEPEVVVS